MPPLKNPFYKPPPKPTDPDQTARSPEQAVRAFLQQRAQKERFEEITLRGLHPALAQDPVWNKVKADLGLVDV